MAINLQIKPEKDYLSISLDGTVDKSEIAPILGKIRDACISYQQPIILINCLALQGLLSTADRYVFAGAFAQLFKERIADLQNKSIHIACVAREPLVDSRKFGENVVVNRGLNFKVFPTITDACAWLGISPPSL